MENSTATLNIEANAWGDSCINGSIKFYDGSMPTDPQTAITTQNLLGSVPFGATPYASASNGTTLLNDTLSSVVSATGTGTWARVFQSDGTTVICDATVGLVGTDIILNDVDFVLDNTLEVLEFDYTRPAL